jgi:uncharacterized protein (UPF0261 family)
MCTTVEENNRMWEIFTEKLNAAIGSVAVMIPPRRFFRSRFPGQPFWCPEAHQAFADAPRKYLRPDIPIVVSENEVNDPEFSSRAAEQLLELIKQKPEDNGRPAQRNSQRTVN